MASHAAHNGFVLPAIGLGTYKLSGSAGVAAARIAVQSGYRLIDSAFNYENEGAMGRGVRDALARGTAGKIAREDVIFTSKLPGRHHERRAALRTIEESVYRSGLDAIDLYLIHWPNPKQGKYVEAWEALIEARERGLVRQIGVSNFHPEHLEAVEQATGVRPVVNQIELHPYYPQEEAVAYHRERGIITEAWSPVGRGNDLAAHPVVAEVAAAHDITPVQAILAWHVARGVVPLPKSGDARRQAENLAAAHLSLGEAEIAAITGLGHPNGRLLDQDPDRHEEF